MILSLVILYDDLLLRQRLYLFVPGRKLLLLLVLFREHSVLLQACLILSLCSNARRDSHVVLAELLRL